MKWLDLEKAVRVQNAFSVFEHALTVGRHWNDQEGVNKAYLDALGEAVERYDQELPPAPFIVGSTPETSLLERLEWVLGVRDPNYDALGEIREIVAQLKKAKKGPTGTPQSYDPPKYTGPEPWPEGATFEGVRKPPPCDECDPSFGCFSKPELCCKKVPT